MSKLRHYSTETLCRRVQQCDRDAVDAGARERIALLDERALYMMELDGRNEPLAIDIPEGGIAYPINEDGRVADFDRVCTFTDGMENCMVVSDRTSCYVVKIGDEEFLVYKPRFQRLVDEVINEPVEA